MASLMAVLGYVTGDWSALPDPVGETCRRSLWRAPTLFLNKDQLREIDQAVEANPMGETLVAALDSVAQRLSRTNKGIAAKLQERVDALRFCMGLGFGVRSGVIWRGFMARSKMGAAVTKGDNEKAREEKEKVAALLDAADETPDAVALMAQLGDMLKADRDAAQGDAVLLTSLHRSKGMEWPVVVLASGGMEGDGVDAAEERRLSYVGITRAQRALVLPAAWEKSAGMGAQAVNDPEGARQMLKMPLYQRESGLEDAISVGNCIYGSGPRSVAAESFALARAYVTMTGEVDVAVGMKTRRGE